MSITTEIERGIEPGTVIPKPEARGDSVVRGWGVSRGERALVYEMPNHKDPSRPYTRRVRRSDFQRAFDCLSETGDLRSDWFKRNMPVCASDGTCNFTTIGGIFVLLGYAEYVPGRGGYRLVRGGGVANRAEPAGGPPRPSSPP